MISTREKEKSGEGMQRETKVEEVAILYIVAHGRPH